MFQKFMNYNVLNHSFRKNSYLNFEMFCHSLLFIENHFFLLQLCDAGKMGDMQMHLINVAINVKKCNKYIFIAAKDFP